MPNFTIGSDPEFMIVEHEELKSAIGLLPDKKTPITKNGSKFYFDNVLAEIALKPAKNREEFLNNIRTALQNLSNIIKPNKFVVRSSGNYPKKELNSIESKIVSCNPEWDVYTLCPIFPPDEDVDLKDGYYQFKTPFRSAGGHLHVGSELLKDPFFAFNLVRMMDLFIAIPSIFLDTDDTSKKRRKIYGHAGSHRVPPHGLEYRALGNFWFASPALAEIIYDLTEFTFDFVCKNNHEKFWSYEEDVDCDEDPSLAFTCFGYDVELLRKAINECDKSIANTFMIFIENYLPEPIMLKIESLKEKPLNNPYCEWNLT